MKKATLALVSLAALSVPVAARADVVIDQNNVTGKRDCGGGEAIVNGNYDSLTFTNCTKVTVNGNHGQIDTGDAGGVSVLGNDNAVTWHASASGVAPKVANLGSRNAVAPARGAAASSDAQTTAPRPAAPATISVDPTGVQVGGIRVDAGGVSVGSTRVQTGAGVPFVVNDNGQLLTHDCMGGFATVNGDRNTLTLRNCAKVEVKGNANSVDAGSPSTLSVLGNRNEVRFQDAAGGTTVSNLGDNNSLVRK